MLISEPARDRYLQEAVDILRGYPETNMLLDFAARENVRIVFNADWIGTRMLGSFTYGQEVDEKLIRLRPGRAPEEMAGTLAHELRHLWQKKQLGILDKKFCDRDHSPRTRFLTMRIFEADAYAFTDLMKRRTDALRADQAEADAMKKTIAAAQGSPLTDAQKTALRQHFSQKAHARLQEDIDFLQERFLQKLDNLARYDARALARYHFLYTAPDDTPHTKPDAAEKPFYTIAHLRRVMRAGVNDNAPFYLQDMTDAALERRALSPIAPAVRRTMRMMEKFEKAAAKNPDWAKSPKAEAVRHRIDRAVRRAVAAQKGK